MSDQTDFLDDLPASPGKAMELNQRPAWVGSDLGLLPVLSIRQPWASAIIHGGKDIENRNWRTNFRGQFLIHASKGVRPEEIDAWAQHCMNAELTQNWAGNFKHYTHMPNAGVIGVAEIVDCVSLSTSPWFVGPWGFVIRNVRPLEFYPCKGALSFFHLSF